MPTDQKPDEGKRLSAEEIERTLSELDRWAGDKTTTMTARARTIIRQQQAELAALKRPVDDAEVEEALGVLHSMASYSSIKYNNPATRIADTITRLAREKAEARDKALEEAAAVADKQFSRWTKHAERAKKRADAGEVLKAVGYQGEPDFELIEAESYRDMAGTISESIRALSPKRPDTGEG